MRHARDVLKDQFAAREAVTLELRHHQRIGLRRLRLQEPERALPEQSRAFVSAAELGRLQESVLGESIELILD